MLKKYEKFHHHQIYITPQYDLKFHAILHLETWLWAFNFKSSDLIQCTLKP